MMRSRPGLVLPLVVGVAVSVACTPAPVPAPPPAGEVASSEEQAKAGAPETAFQCEPGKEYWRSPGVPKRGGTFTVASTTGGNDHLDVSKGGRKPLLYQVYNGLFETRACYHHDTAAVPKLIRSWEMSPDGRTWTLKLREGVTWHNKPPVNGRPLTSRDVAWTIEHQKEGGLGRAYWRDVAHEEPDPHTVVLRLPEPEADFLSVMGSSENLILPREVKDQYGDFKTVAIGTGAFVLREFKGPEYTLIVRNPGYWEKGEDGGSLPYLDEVREVAFGDYTAEIAAMRSGQLDRTRSIGVRRTDVEALKQSNPKIQHHVQWVAGYGALYFNLQKPPWNDVRVRKAAALAIDSEDLVASNQGAAVYASFVPALFTDHAWSQEKMKEKFKPDPDQAKRLLAHAGYQPGTIQGTIETGGAYLQDAEVVQHHLEKLGIKTTVEAQQQNFTPTLERGEYPDLAYGQVGGRFWVGNWIADRVRTGSSYNFIRFSDPKVDELAIAQAKELDPQQRKRVIGALQDRLYEILPLVPTVTRVWDHLYSCRVRNFKPNIYNAPGVATTWLDERGC